MSPPQTEFEKSGDSYRLVVRELGISIEVDYLRRESSQLKGELLVRCNLPGARTFDGVLSHGDFNLSSSRVREGQAKYLATRARTKPAEVDWIGLLEEFCQRVLESDKDGDDLGPLAELERPGPDEALHVIGLRLLARHPVIFFGDGGTAKSYIGLYIAGLLAERGRRVALFDWELAGEDHRDRLERLFGGDGMPEILYGRCTRPLVHEAVRLRRAIRKHKIDYAIFDSISFACNGPPEAAEVANGYFQALRSMGKIGSLHIAHVAKALEGADKRPFGSTFWHNGARATWNVKIAESMPGLNTTTIALHNRKANLGPLRPSLAFRFTFTEDSTKVNRIDIADEPDLTVDLSIRQRMALAVRHGSMDPEALGEEIDANPDTIRRTARRYKNQFIILDGGKIGLLQK